MRLPWSRKPDPIDAEVAEQSARSKETLEHVERVLETVIETLDDHSRTDAALIEAYNRADQERLARRKT